MPYFGFETQGLGPEFVWGLHCQDHPSWQQHDVPLINEQPQSKSSSLCHLISHSLTQPFLQPFIFHMLTCAFSGGGSIIRTDELFTLHHSVKMRLHFSYYASKSMNTLSDKKWLAEWNMTVF